MSEQEQSIRSGDDEKRFQFAMAKLAEVVQANPLTMTSTEILEMAIIAITRPARPSDIWRGLMTEADRVAEAKGKDYTKGSDDRLANFKTAGNDAGITPLQAWLVFYNKHHAAICSYIRTGGQSESEPIKGRFVDAINYLRLGWLLVLDAKDNASRAIEGTLT